MSKYAIVKLEGRTRDDGSIVVRTSAVDLMDVTSEKPVPKEAGDVPGCTTDVLQAILDKTLTPGQKLSIVARGGAGCAIVHDWTEMSLLPRALRGIYSWAKTFAPRLFDANGTPVPHLCLNTALRDLFAPREPGKKDTQSGVMELADFFATAVCEMSELALFVKETIDALMRPVLPNDYRKYQSELDNELLKAVGLVRGIFPGFVHDLPLELYPLPGMGEVDGLPAFTPTEPGCGAFDALYAYRLRLNAATRGKIVCQDTEGMEKGGSWSYLNRSRHVNIPTWDTKGMPCIVSIEVGRDGLVPTGEPIVTYPKDLEARYTNKACMVLRAMLSQMQG